MTSAAADPVAIGAEIERLIGALSGQGGSARPAQELVQHVMAFYGAGLHRMIDIVKAERGGDAIVARFASDPLVRSLLELHEAAPPPAPALIQITRRPLAALHDGPAADRCGLCDASVAEPHPHLVDAETGRLLCACAACAAAGGRYRRVPSRYVQLPPLSAARLASLEIPVGLVFFVRRSRGGRTLAYYPGAAGATESLVPPEAWSALVADRPDFASAAADVEALLVRRAGGECQCWIAPLDASYALVGRIRKVWTGMTGGEAVGREISSFFDGITATASGARGDAV